MKNKYFPLHSMNKAIFNKNFEYSLYFFQAGLHKDKLTIALEPEAASIFVRHLPVDSKTGSLEISRMQAGIQYIILDAGGTLCTFVIGSICIGY